MVTYPDQILYAVAIDEIPDGLNDSKYSDPLAIAFREAAQRSVQEGAVAFKACYDAYSSPVELTRVERAGRVEALLNPSGDNEVASVRLSKRQMGFDR